MYDPELHAQMKADIARLEQRFHACGQAPGRRRDRLLRRIEETAPVDDLVSRAVLERRRQALLAQTEGLPMQGARLEAAGAAD